MNQRKYIMSAVLVLVVGATIYLGFRKFPQGTNSENTSTVIDYDEPTDIVSKAILNGKTLYISKCETCHGSFKKLDGPWLSLAGVEFKWPDKKELIAFIRNPEEVRKKNAYAKRLKEVWGSTNKAFPEMTDEEIQSVIDYIKWEKEIK